MKTIQISTIISPIILGILLVVLPGCEWPDWFGCCKKGIKTEEDSCCGMSASQSEQQAKFVAPNDTTQVLAYINGEPFVTRGQVKKEIEKLIESNPQFKAMQAMIDPAELEFRIMQGLIHVGVLKNYVTEGKLDQRADYQKKLNEAIDSIKNMLNVEFFSQSLPVKVSTAEVKEFYEENKDKFPQLMLSKGGVKAACVEFNNEKDAQDFVAKVNAYEGDIKKAVQEQGLTGVFKDFMVINNQSFGYDALLREKILEIETMPSTQVCAVGDNSFYVVTVSGKEEATYQPFNVVEKQLRDHLESEQRKKAAEVELAKLAQQYKVSMSQEGIQMAKKIENAAQQAQESEAQEFLN